jgi:DNA-binding SARP family transcriptional activator/Tfp pilus assembly protein PilF/DNA-binding XRE family transcriptional regulator
MGQARPGQAGGLIRGYRREAGLTQQQLADAALVSIGVVRDLEQGRTAHLRAESARRLARALRLDRRQATELVQAARGNTRAAAPARPGGLRVGVLGPLRAWRGGAAVALGGTMQRAVLGLLALHADTGLRRTAIIDELWGDDPPDSAVAMIQSYISRLRQLLNPGGPAPARGGLLVAAGGGYQLQAAGCELDHVTFAALVGRARDAQAAGDLAAACEAYARALALWRDEPLADLDVLRDHPAVTRLSRERAEAVAGYAEAASAAGWHDRALAELQELTRREPLNERVQARLMIALAGSGRQAEAMGVYAELRHRLDDQLGVRPGPEVADAHRRVLRQDIAAAAGAAAPASPARPPSGDTGRAAAKLAVPRQLPGLAPHFAGRDAELKALTDMLDQAAGAGTTAVISAIGGTAGVGKTALAVHWAYQVAQRFPDGQLYVNLRGYDPGQPMPAADALAGFLRALGVPGRDIPAATDERAARYRSLLAGRHMLVLLDNAADVEHVRPLLPGTPAAVAVVTSRDSLAGLVARDGARRLDLDLLPSRDAVGLLRALIGERVNADPGATAALADHCSRLPLALRVAAELAAARPAAPLAGLVRELSDQQQRLDLLEAGGDSRTAVRAVFSWSYRHLSPAAARAFRLSGLHPGPDHDAYAAAALTGSTLERALRLLDQLARAHLVQPGRPGRYGRHDLLRAYARELAAAEDGEEERRMALTRLFDHYLHTAAAAMDTLFPAEGCRRPRVRAPAAPGPPVTGPAAARGWLDAERVNLVATAAYAADAGWPGHATRLAATLFRYLDDGGYYPEAITIHTHARHAARGSGDRAAEATALTNLGAIDVRQGRYQQAAGHLQKALALFQETGDQAGQARALSNLGLVDLRQGRYQQATSHLQQALALFQETGDQAGQARALGNLGLVDLRQGRYQQATSHLEQTLARCRETGDRTSEAYALRNLGDVDLRQGRYQQADEHLQQALALFRETGNRIGEAYALCGLGDVHLRQGARQLAGGHHRQALALFREIGDVSGEAEALNGLGEVFLAAGQSGQARIQHVAALDLADRIGDQDQQARAHNGLARSHDATGDLDQARHHRREARIRYASLGVPQADQVTMS